MEFEGITDEPVMNGLTRRGAIGAMAVSASALAGPTAAAEASDSPWTSMGHVPFGGGRLHFAKTGTGNAPPLVLLPKLGGWIADWRLAAPALASAGRPVIAIDPPGHGGSTMSGPPPYMMTMPECAAIVLAALDQMGVEEFAVAGNSMGGIIGILLAALWPARVQHLVIVSSSLIGAMSLAQIREQDAQNAEKERLAKAGRGLTPEQERMRLFGTTDPRVNAEQLAGRARAGAWLRPCERGVGRVGVIDYLPRVRAPTLLVNSDRGAYAKYADVGRRLLPQAQSVIISGAGSFVHQERPAEVASAINTFLGSQRAPGQPESN